MKDKKSLGERIDYKLGLYSYNYFKFMFKYWIGLGIVITVLFFTAIFAKYTSYEAFIRYALGTDTNNWFMYTLLGYAGWSFINLFIGMSSFFHELDREDEDE